MARTVAIGIQRFEDLIEKDYFYIDKTDFIREWWESGDSVTLITRPRRFGKTLNMSMLENFFSIKHADKKSLFEGLKIWENVQYRKLQGTYPVISLSFANVKEKNFEAAKERISQLITELYSQNVYLRNSEFMTVTDKEYFDSVRIGMSEVTATLAIYKMCDFLYRYYGKKVIVLLDEYDTPMQEAYVNGYWEELAGFARSMFHAAFKTNPWLERGMMTGITRISKESIFSDLNNLEIVTTTSDKYTAAFGFTEEEVFSAMEEYGLSDKKEEVKCWYDGFVFGKCRDIYNPWSILNFLSSGLFKTYWANTSSNSLADTLLRRGSRRVKQKFEQLLSGEQISCTIDEQIVYNRLDRSEDAIWSLLLASGYLKVLKKEEESTEREGFPKYEMVLTNYEVRRMFEYMIHDWFAEPNGSYNDFVEALLRCDMEAMNAYMQEVALSMFSYFDVGNGKYRENPERFYHGFVLGLMVDMKGDYIVTSNRESGFGRYDVMLEPRDKRKNAYILEFKVINKNSEITLEETVSAALKQIEEKQYEAQLVAAGIPKEHIYSYGFAFEGKRVLIGELYRQ